MPRQPRIDLPGLLQHVIVRGIERSVIFVDDKDRQHFIERFGQLLVETGTDCYAWALIPNHFHLLLRINHTELSRFMRRLLTGYAVYFNRRHKRSGHLFQNRYKSIVCEEDPYQLELIRYIHLNPLRAGQVSDIEQLDTYPWCGHVVLLNQQILPGQSVDDVLLLFGKRASAARKNYRQFIIDGLAMGKRPDLLGAQKAERASVDENNSLDNRVLGSSAFVKTLCQEEPAKGAMSLEELQNAVATLYSIAQDDLRKRGRQNVVSKARILFCYLAVSELSYTCKAVGLELGMGTPAVSRGWRLGEVLFRANDGLQKWWSRTLKQ